MQSERLTLPALDRLIASLAREAVVDEIWLYGSRARGDASERADIDLAVRAPRATDRQWIAIQDLVEEAETLLPIDLVRLERAPQSLATVIAAEGRKLYER